MLEFGDQLMAAFLSLPAEQRRRGAANPLRGLTASVYYGGVRVENEGIRVELGRIEGTNGRLFCCYALVITAGRSCLCEMSSFW